MGAAATTQLDPKLHQIASRATTLGWETGYFGFHLHSSLHTVRDKKLPVTAPGKKQTLSSNSHVNTATRHV